MPQYVITKRDFTKGLALSNELGGFFADMRGIDIYNSDEHNNSAAVNALGSIRAGAAATDVGGATVITLISQIIPVVNPADLTNGELYLFCFGDDRCYRIRTITEAPTAVTLLDSSTDIGAAYYHNGTDGRVYVTSLMSVQDIGTDIFGTMTSRDLTATEGAPLLTTGVPHPLFVKNDILFGGDRDEIFQKSGTTWTDSVLDLDRDQIIQTISEYDRYLAIGSMQGINPQRTVSSRVYFWDMISDSWSFSANLPGAIIQLKNIEGILYALTSTGTSGSFGIYYFNGSQFKPLAQKIDGATALTVGYGEKSGKTMLGHDRGRFFFPVKDLEGEARPIGITTGQILMDVWSYGSYYPEMPQKFHKSFNVLTTPTDTGVNIGALSVIPDKVYVSYQAGTNFYKLVVFKKSTGVSTSSFWTTTDLDSYFGGTGRLKKLNFIRFDFDPLASGDVVEVYKALDHSKTYSRIDGGGSVAATNSIRYADIQSETSIGFSMGDTFRELNLGAAHTNGDVRIRRIVVDFDWAD